MNTAESDVALKGQLSPRNSSLHAGSLPYQLSCIRSPIEQYPSLFMINSFVCTFRQLVLIAT